MNTTIKQINGLKREILEIVGDTLKQTQINEVFDKFLEDLEDESGASLTKKLEEISKKWKDVPGTDFPYRPLDRTNPLTSPFVYPNGPTCDSTVYTAIASIDPKDWPTATFSSELSTGIDTKDA